MKAIGIDFGTTNSVAAVFDGAGAEVLPIGEPPAEWVAVGFDEVMPSIVALDDARSLVFGWDAKQLNTATKFEAIKRLFREEEVVSAGGEQFYVEEIATALFRHIKHQVLGRGVDVAAAVVTIPANSRGLARYRTKVCAGMGGIEPLALLNEPTAAAMGYARRHNADGQKILVFDFGGGTLDVTLLESRSGVFFEQASSGVARLGGIDFDNAIYRHIADELPQSSTWTSIDRDRIMLQIEHAKIRLSSDADETVISDPALPAFRLTRPKFNEITGHLVERLRSPIERVLADLRMSAGDVDQLLLVGGTSKVPAVRQHVSEIMGREPATGIDPMTAVGQGAAIAAAILTGELDDTDFFVSTEHALGTVVADTQSRTLMFSQIIPRNQKLPARQSDIFVPVQDFQESVHVAVLEGDPDQPIAHPDNLLLAEFDVPLEPARPAEDVQIELTYSYDTDGLLHVDVADYQSGEALTDRVTLAFTGALGGKDLVEIAARVRSAVDDGTAANGQSVQASQELDPASAKLITCARSKVIPFVDDHEGTFLRDLVDRLQSASDGDIEDARRALEDALRPYSYLF